MQLEELVTRPTADWPLLTSNSTGNDLASATSSSSDLSFSSRVFEGNTRGPSSIHHKGIVEPVRTPGTMAVS
ncbi:hypothetical protein K0M31_011825 [Melipona bicolor]|uniref:Uncharacterized protein n=1 Tax=Melipona bicolor TaxID=60889 RepID=A0AA40GAA4_9HYME|nr:hypothetical protein K0M31_011825 [Melipona bicolor]